MAHRQIIAKAALDGATSLMGQSLPKWNVRVTSAFPLIATEERTSRDVSNVPTAELAVAAYSSRNGTRVTLEILLCGDHRQTNEPVDHCEPPFQIFGSLAQSQGAGSPS